MIHHHFDKARRKARAVLAFCLLTLLSFNSACLRHEYDSIEEDAVPLTFYLQPTAPHTRGYLGDIDEEQGQGEDAIHSIKVWLYDGSTFLDYTEEIDADKKVTMTIPKRVVNKGTVDVYVIANAESAGAEVAALDGDSELDDILGATIDNTKFSATNPVTIVPNGANPFGTNEKGLPMSRIKKGCAINTTGVTPTLETIEITRAVSKILFAFARTKDHTGQVLGITIGREKIAKSEYIFGVDPAENPTDYVTPYFGDRHAHILSSDGYEDATMQLGLTAAPTGNQQVLHDSGAIEEVYDDNDPTLDPSDYAWDNWSAMEANISKTDQQKATDYYNLMDTYVKDNVYLRESDIPLEGTVYYRLSPTSIVKTARFQMMTNSNGLQDFARNHIWIVYGYFSGDRLELKIRALEWNYYKETIDYKENVVVTRNIVWDDLTINGREVVDATPKYFNIVTSNTASTYATASFTFDDPRGGEWFAVLEPLDNATGDEYFWFVDEHGNRLPDADAPSSYASGAIGLPGIIRIATKPRQSGISRYARLVFTVRSGREFYQVHAATIDEYGYEHHLVIPSL